MSGLDLFVLIATLVVIAVYGAWVSRDQKDLKGYLKGGETLRWGTIGLSIMATQASAITFLSTPGLGYESGLRFVQNYFGLPIAMVVICAVFLPIYRRQKVYTAYEYLGQRFDAKTRYLGAVLFLTQRGLAAGITLYAPAIVIATVLGWRLDLTILAAGLLVILYTVSGGTKAVSVTQQWQMGVMLLGMFVAFAVLLHQVSQAISPTEALHLAGGLGKLEAVDFSFDPNERYTVWTGLLGGTFLALSYFGTDQSQVQRYLTGRSLAASRFGLLFNGVVKIPMQFFILLTGVLVFVFYQFVQPPIHFKDSAWAALDNGPYLSEKTVLESDFEKVFLAKREAIDSWRKARADGSPHLEEATFAEISALADRERELAEQARSLLSRADPAAETNDTDYIFITWVLAYLPQGLVGLLLAVIFCAAMSSSASELNALATTSVVDLYRPIFDPGASDARLLGASKAMTAVWGAVALGFALFAHMVENLIEAVNILGSLFYGTVLGLFLVAFFTKRVGGTAVFWAGVTAQCTVLVLYFTTSIGYLWFNLIGCALTVFLSLILHKVIER